MARSQAVQRVSWSCDCTISHVMPHMTQDCERREGECLSTVTSLRNKFDLLCKEMNISVSEGKWEGEEGEGRRREVKKKGRSEKGGEGEIGGEEGGEECNGCSGYTSIR